MSLSLNGALRFISVVKNKKSFWTHFVAILTEIIGTFFIFMDATRLNERIPSEGLSLGDEPRFQAWYCHAGHWGFLLIFAGILAQVILVVFHTHEISDLETKLEDVDKRLKRVESLSPPKDTPPKQDIP